MTKLCTSTFSLKNPSSIDTYLSQDGYSSWKKIISKEISKSEVIKIYISIKKESRQLTNCINDRLK